MIQKNLVYVVGLSERIANADILKRAEYFGRYGRIQKIVVGTPSHIQPPAGGGVSYAAYVTYVKWEDALRCIAAINTSTVDGKVLKASLGTTKYCSAFLRSAACSKTECMYLHDVADSVASFTKEDMQQGKHNDYERRLAESLLGPKVGANDAKSIRNRSASPVGRHEHDGDAATVNGGANGADFGRSSSQRNVKGGHRGKSTRINANHREKSASTERLTTGHLPKMNTRNNHNTQSSTTKAMRTPKLPVVYSNSNNTAASSIDESGALSTGSTDEFRAQFSLSDDSDGDHDTTITAMWPPEALSEAIGVADVAASAVATLLPPGLESVGAPSKLAAHQSDATSHADASCELAAAAQ